MRPIIVVSGLPRSGTSLMMQMLHAGGVEVIADQLRTADEDNPRGYFEFEQVKNLRNDASWLASAEGKAVKIIHLLLRELPVDRTYQVLFMRRDLREVIQSQSMMLSRLGRNGAALPPDRLIAVFEQQLAQIDDWLRRNACFKVFRVGYADLMADPTLQAESIADFLDRDLDVGRMASAVDPSLHRNRVP